MLFAAVGIVVGHGAGWLPSNVVTIHAMQFGSALEMLLLSFALAERIQMDRHAREAAQAQALAAGQAMLDQARESERLLESRVHERTAALAWANEQLRHNEAELRRLAHHDPLTGLPNRKLFLDRLDHAIDRARRQGTAFAVLSLDLDGFKLVNDRHGHAAGDELLVAIAARLTATLRASDTVARWGGDEFVLILEDLSDPHTAQPPVAKLTALVEEPVSLRSGAVVRVGVSIGVASFPGDGDRAEVLLEQADQAMYVRKDESRRRAA
jgi:diguanylate cyclase (GGDEF)-like protein